MAVAAAVLVFVNASAATPFAASAEPALNPNQPNHNNPAPSSTSGTLWGTIGVRLKSRRGASMRAAPKGDTPARTRTTGSAAQARAPPGREPPPAPPTP